MGSPEGWPFRIPIIGFTLLPIRELKRMENKRGCIRCCNLLSALLILVLIAIPPVANGLHQNPVSPMVMQGSVQTRPLHFSANRFRFKFKQLLSKAYIVHKDLASQQ